VNLHAGWIIADAACFDKRWYLFSIAGGDRASAEQPRGTSGVSLGPQRPWGLRESKRGGFVGRPFDTASPTQGWQPPDKVV